MEIMYARNIEEKDREMLQKAIDADAFHGKEKGFTPGIFFEPGTKTVVYGDDEGDVLAVNVRKLDLVLLTVQFFGASKERTREVIKQGLPAFEQVLKKSGVDGIMFETKNPALAFFMKKLGFKRKRLLVKYL
jgi:hypothetical protein